MITDWDDAYANGAHVEGSERYADIWTEKAAAFRGHLLDAGRADIDLAYGSAERARLDIFRPAGKSVGLVVFIHGGYWRSFDKSFWSHLAAGPLEHGWTVCVPSYTLAPETRVSKITRQIASAVGFAAERVDGPIRLTGHSAGGHLASRMLCANLNLPDTVRSRIAHTVSISGVHDLRPLLRTELNQLLHLDEEEARAESPALLRPVEAATLTCWVGADERPEFIRQTDLLANIWTGLGATTKSVHVPGKHHFNIVEDLADPASDLVAELLG